MPQLKLGSIPKFSENPAGCEKYFKDKMLSAEHSSNDGKNTPHGMVFFLTTV